MGREDDDSNEFQQNGGIANVVEAVKSVCNHAPDVSILFFRSIIGEHDRGKRQNGQTDANADEDVPCVGHGHAANP